MLARDMGAGNVLGPVSVELRKRGHDVFLLAEEGGQAMNRLQVPFQVADEAALEKLLLAQKPSVIVTGLSSPRMLETRLDQYAECRNVPLVHIEDYWGAHVRSPVLADLVITIDETAKRLVRAARQESRVAVAGFAGIAPVTPRPSLIEKFDAIRKTGGKILVYPDGGEECQFALPMLVDSILLSETPIYLALKIHPKFKTVPHPSGTGTWDDWCQTKIHPLRERARVLDLSEPTDEVVEAADGVASCYSTLLIRPAAKGKVAITLWDRIIERLLKRETGLDQTPLMLTGQYPVLDGVRSLDDFFAVTWPALDLKPFNASIAADAIEELVS